MTWSGNCWCCVDPTNSATSATDSIIGETKEPDVNSYPYLSELSWMGKKGGKKTLPINDEHAKTDKAMSGYLPDNPLLESANCYNENPDLALDALAVPLPETPSEAPDWKVETGQNFF